METATVQAIEKATRSVTLLAEDGTYSVVTAPPEMKRFDELKVGDRNQGAVLREHRDPPQGAGREGRGQRHDGRTRGTGVRPGATVAEQRTITATITQLDPKVPSITFTGPNGWKYSSHVEDKKALAKVKVGDKVDITWTQAALVSIDDEAKK